MPVLVNRSTQRYWLITWHKGTEEKCSCVGKIHHFSAVTKKREEEIVFIITCAECPVFKVAVPLTRTWLQGVHKYALSGNEEDYDAIEIFK